MTEQSKSTQLGGTALPRYRWQSSIRARRLVKNLFLYPTVIAGAVVLTIPLLWLVSTSFKDTSLIFNFPPQWIPNPIAWWNFVDIWTEVPFAMFLKNTVILTSINIVGGVMSASFVAFGFARLRFPGRDVLFMILLGTLMLPSQVTLIPQFVLFRILKWLDSFKPLTVPVFFGGSAYYIFLLRQFYMRLPLALDDAARIDGCSSFGIYWRIILPQSRPVLGVLAIFSFLGNWNGFFLPLIYLNSMEKYPLALGLMLFRGMNYTAWNMLMAGSVLMSLPCIVVYFVAQRYFVQGIVFTGVEK
jgi:ABC-type glycerol-3-phosphate transport system permease component